MPRRWCCPECRPNLPWNFLIGGLGEDYVCGIVGFWNPHGGDEGLMTATVTAMADTLRHRGPDSSGVWVRPELGVALGHRRLAIVDLSASGHQPMTSPTGRFVIVFNGEIYNFLELKRDLEALGCRFRGTSDTEVLLRVRPESS